MKREAMTREGRLACLRERYLPNVRLPGDRSRTYVKETDTSGGRDLEALHGGSGVVHATFFAFDQAALPASFEEFYYVVAGFGEMQIGAERVPVRAGDHVFVPIGVARGIANRSDTETLKVLVTFVFR